MDQASPDAVAAALRLDATTPSAGPPTERPRSIPPRLEDLSTRATTVDLHATFGEHATRLVAATPGFLVTDGDRVVAAVGNDRLLSMVSRVGGDLFRHRTLAVLLEVMHVGAPVHVSPDTSVEQAVAMALARPASGRLDPMVLATDAPRLLDLVPLLLAHAELAAETAAEADRQRQSAEAAGRARTAFLATMSHELRTPLNAILGFVELLHDRTLDERESLRSLGVIQRNGQHLLALVSDMLDLTRLESGQVPFESLPLNPSELVADVTESLHAKATAGCTELRCLVDRTAPRLVLGDCTRLRQVMFNVVGNAVKFSPGATVEVRLGAVPADEASDAPTWFVQCRDTGVGMAPEVLERIFEPFVQADAGITRRFGGTGLGLSIVRRIIDAEGGSITVESCPGRGTTIRIDLPWRPAATVDAPRAAGCRSLAPSAASSTCPSPAPSPASASRSAPAPASAPTDPSPIPRTADGPPPVPPAAGETRRVLVVEDGLDNIRLFRTVLEKAGYAVSIAEDGEAGIAVAERARHRGAPFHCILMDRHMPVMDGCEATRRLRAAGHRTPIIAVTASASAEDRADFAAAGCDQFLPKPLPPRVLREAVAAAIDAAEAGAPIERGRHAA